MQITNKGQIFKIKTAIKENQKYIKVFIKGDKMPLTGSIFNINTSKSDIKNWALKSIAQYYKPTN